MLEGVTDGLSFERPKVWSIDVFHHVDGTSCDLKGDPDVPLVVAPATTCAYERGMDGEGAGHTEGPSGSIRDSVVALDVPTGRTVTSG